MFAAIGKDINCIAVVWDCTRCESKMEKQDLQAGKVDDRTPALWLARSRSNNQKESEMWIGKDGFKPRLRLDWKIVETF